MATIKMLENLQVCLDGRVNTLFRKGVEYSLGDQGLTQRGLDAAINRGAAKLVRKNISSNIDDRKPKE